MDVVSTVEIFPSLGDYPHQSLVTGHPPVTRRSVGLVSTNIGSATLTHTELELRASAQCKDSVLR
jgi:hypothetical protein